MVETKRKLEEECIYKELIRRSLRTESGCAKSVLRAGNLGLFIFSFGPDWQLRAGMVRVLRYKVHKA